MDEIVFSGFLNERKFNETQCDEQICQYFNSDSEQKNNSKFLSRFVKGYDYLE
jgi:hypothetical protein